MYDTVVLLNDVHQFTTTESTNELKTAITKFLESKPDVTLTTLFKEFGFSQYQEIMVAVHFMVVDDHLLTMSPYDLDAPEPDEHEIICVFDDISTYETVDLLNDYGHILQDFGKDSMAVKLYRRELEKRGHNAKQENS